MKTRVSVGFTGTGKRGMTNEQKLQVRHLLSELNATELHHGDCVGADSDAHDIAVELDIPVYVHPPTNPAKRAFKRGSVVLEPKAYLDRNMDIVINSNVLIAAPLGFSEVLRSGTWSTVRRARGRGIPVIIVYPDSKTERR